MTHESPSEIDDSESPARGNCSDPTQLCAIGIAHVKDGNHGKALEVFEEAIRIDLNCAEAFGGRGRCLFNMQRYDDAVEDFTRCIEMDAKTQCLSLRATEEKSFRFSNTMIIREYRQESKSTS